MTWDRALIMQSIDEKPNISCTIRIFRARDFEHFHVGISICVGERFHDSLTPEPSGCGIKISTKPNCDLFVLYEKIWKIESYFSKTPSKVVHLTICRGCRTFFNYHYYPSSMRLREASKKVLYDIYNFLAYHYFQMIGQFLTSCCLQLLEKLGYCKKVVRS